MSDHCKLDIKNLGNNWVEVKFTAMANWFQRTRNNCRLILAGDAKNDTAWLVVIKKDKAVNAVPAKQNNFQGILPDKKTPRGFRGAFCLPSWMSVQVNSSLFATLTILNCSACSAGSARKDSLPK